MQTGWRLWVIGLAILGFAAALSCGGDIVGLGNSNNRILDGAGLAEELAEALAEQAATPRIEDATLVEIFGAILARARSGDAESALIVLRVAESQRAREEG